MTTLEIAVRPHIKQWVEAEYGISPKATKANILGGVVLNAVRGSFASSREIVPAGRAKLSVILSKPLSSYAGNENTVREVGYLLEEHFTLAVVSYVQGHVAAGKTAYSALHSFYDFYGFNPDDYDLEALRKIWRDHQSRKTGRTQDDESRAAA